MHGKGRFRKRSFHPPSQGEKGDTAWEDHESIDQVRDAPDQIHGKHCANVDHDDIAQMIGYKTSFPKQVFSGFFSIITPADEGGEGKSNQGKGQKGFPAEGEEGKGC